MSDDKTSKGSESVKMFLLSLAMLMVNLCQNAFISERIFLSPLPDE